MKVAVTQFYIFSLVFGLVCGSGGGVTNAQAGSIKVNFVKDGRPVDVGFRMRIYTDAQTYNADRGHNRRGIKPKIKEGAFAVPPGVMQQETVVIHFASRELDLTFFDVPAGAFEASSWTVGVDTRPFEKENLMESVSERAISMVTYLEFLSKEGKKIKVLVNRHK